MVCVLALSGCTASTTPQYHSVVPTEQVDESHPQILVVYGNEEFKDKLYVLRKVFDESGTLARVSLTLQNVSNDIFVVEYQFRWLEQSGMPIMQTPAWSRMTLAPNAVKPLINIAKVPEAKIVEFTVRLPMTGVYDPPREN